MAINRCEIISPLRTEEVYFCHQNQNAKHIGNFMTLLKPHNIGMLLKGIETSFQVVPLFLKSFHFWGSFINFCNFLKIPSVFKGLKKFSRTFSATKMSWFTLIDFKSQPTQQIIITANRPFSNLMTTYH
jgi:hypothetical protein